MPAGQRLVGAGHGQGGVLLVRPGHELDPRGQTIASEAVGHGDGGEAGPVSQGAHDVPRLRAEGAAERLVNGRRRGTARGGGQGVQPCESAVGGPGHEASDTQGAQVVLGQHRGPCVAPVAVHQIGEAFRATALDELVEGAGGLGHEDGPGDRFVGEVRQGHLLDGGYPLQVAKGAVEVVPHVVMDAVRSVPQDAEPEGSSGGAAGVVVKGGLMGGGVQGVRAGDGLQDKAAVVGVEAQGAQLVQRPAQGHGAVAAHSAVGGPEAGDAADAGGREDGAPGLGAYGEGDETRRHGGR